MAMVVVVLEIVEVSRPTTAMMAALVRTLQGRRGLGGWGLCVGRAGGDPGAVGHFSGGRIGAWDRDAEAD